MPEETRSLPRAYSTPVESIDAHLGALRVIGIKLVEGHERLKLTELGLLKEVQRLTTTCDELRDQVRQKDAMIDELREMQKPMRRQANR